MADEKVTDGYTRNFSAAIRSSGFVFVSGQASVDDRGVIVGGTFAEEMHRSMENLRRVLARHGLDMSDVVKVNAFIDNPADFAEYNELYHRYFSLPLPARTTIANCLAGRVKFEVEVIAADRTRDA